MCVLNSFKKDALSGGIAWYLGLFSILQKLKKELERLKDDLGTITNKCEEFFSQAAASPSVPTLRSELSVVIQNMNQVHSMSSTYMDKYVTTVLI